MEQMLENSKQKRRMEWLDMAKGIGMILVIYSHACSNFNMFNQWICSFFMPLFFVCSGYCYSFKEHYLKRNVNKILLPYYLWGGAGIVFSVIKSIAKGTMGEFDLFGHVWKLLLGISMDNYPIWFLVAFFVCKTAFDTIFCIVSRMEHWQKKNQSIVLGVLVWTLAAGGYVYSQLKTGGHSVFRFDTGLAMLPFFWLGFILKEKKILEMQLSQSRKMLLAVGCLTVNVITGLFLNGLVSVNSNDFGNVLMFCFSSVSGTMAVFLICQILEPITLLQKGLAEIGRYSMMIMCSHMFALSFVGIISLVVFHSSPHKYLLFIGGLMIEYLFVCFLNYIFDSRRVKS